MPTFYARGDSSTANNAALNAQGTSARPTATLVFSGDPRLDDTTALTVNGVAATYTYEFSGDLPYTNKLSNVNGQDLRGEQIIVITVSGGQRYFFLSDGSASLATMNAFPNGAHALTNVVVCFAAGTLIATPGGERAVEALLPGDEALTSDGRTVVLRWIGSRHLTGADLEVFPHLRPIRIQAGALGADRPRRDLVVSPQHRILLSDWRAELLFGERDILVAAKHLVNDRTIAIERNPGGIAYWHLMFDRHEILLSAGLETESFHPGEVALTALERRVRDEVLALFPALSQGSAEHSATAAPVMRAYEGRALSGFSMESTPYRGAMSPAARPAWNASAKDPSEPAVMA